MLSKENIYDFPKIELHCHLDGSLRANSILEESHTNDVKLTDREKYNIENLLKAPKVNESLVSYLKSFDIPIRVMQNKKSIERFTFEVYEDASKENVKYLELRFAPSLHTKMGLNQSEVIEAAISGMKNATKKYDIEGNLILCCMKNLSEKIAIETIERGRDYLNHGVVAVDLAGPEEEGFSTKFINAMSLAKKYGYKITIHAGEVASGQNILDSIKMLDADRIGHGVRLYDNIEAYEIIKNRNIMLEVCPTSNIQTNAVSSLQSHPVVSYYNDKLNLCINTDNRTVSDTTLTEEYVIASKLLNMGKDDYNKMYSNTVKSSFADNSVKEFLLRKI